MNHVVLIPTHERGHTGALVLEVADAALALVVARLSQPVSDQRAFVERAELPLEG